jgi:hypothetical protein
MLTLRRPVYFPQLVFVEEIAFNSNDDKSPIYKLDWTKFNEHHTKKHEDWNRKFSLVRTAPMIDLVPKVYGALVDDSTYLLTDNYLSEINRCFRQAFEEWQTKKPFDSCIAGITMEIQKAYLYVGFKLLCDCMLNKSKSFYEKSVLKRVAPHVMLIRFWQHNVGCGLVEEFAMLNKLKTPEGKVDTDEIIKKNFIEEFTLNLETYEKEITKYVPHIKQDALEDIRSKFLESGDISDSVKRIKPCCEKDTDGDGDCPTHKKPRRPYSPFSGPLTGPPA